MTKRSALLLGLSAVCLQGCIAAAAIPIVAGAGGVVRGGLNNSVSDEDGDDINSGDEATVEETVSIAPSPAPSPETPAEPASPEVADIAESVPPAPAPPSAPTPVAAADNPYTALRDYALETLADGAPFASAQLADPTSLQPDRRSCDGVAATVVLDLDPAEGVLPLAGPVAVNAPLARVLTELRARGVTIAWITNRTATDAGAIRDRLVASGLDPEGLDSVFVERYPGETKQARRDALAQSHCVIALAGDERSDFDDLYNFIIDEADARPLDPMLGAGWFLIPHPVSE